MRNIYYIINNFNIKYIFNAFFYLYINPYLIKLNQDNFLFTMVRCKICLKELSNNSSKYRHTREVHGPKKYAHFAFIFMEDFLNIIIIVKNIYHINFKN